MSDSTLKRLRAIKAEIAALGGEILSIDQGKHLKVRFRNPAGREHMLLVSRSPSDWRAGLDTTARLRRMMRATGETPEAGKCPASFSAYPQASPMRLSLRPTDR